MASERPKKLSKAELEQYNVLLEEQAFPFEEKAAELHEVNAHRAHVERRLRQVGPEQLRGPARAAPGALRQERSQRGRRRCDPLDLLRRIVASCTLGTVGRAGRMRLRPSSRSASRSTPCARHGDARPRRHDSAPDKHRRQQKGRRSTSRRAASPSATPVALLRSQPHRRGRENIPRPGPGAPGTRRPACQPRRHLSAAPASCPRPSPNSSTAVRLSPRRAGLSSTNSA